MAMSRACRPLVSLSLFLDQSSFSSICFFLGSFLVGSILVGFEREVQVGSRAFLLFACFVLVGSET